MAHVWLQVRLGDMNEVQDFYQREFICTPAVLDTNSNNYPHRRSGTIVDLPGILIKLHW
jgi:hypothetical protein